MNSADTNWWTAIGVIVAGLGVIVAGLALRANTRKTVGDDGKWRGRVDTLLEQIGKDLTELRQIVFARFGVPVVVPKSPLKLTEFGKTISGEVDAPGWVERVAPDVEDRIAEKDPYEIQEFCFGYAAESERYREEERRAIRRTAFRRGLEVSEIERVLAIELRDRILKMTDQEPPA